MSSRTASIARAGATVFAATLAACAASPTGVAGLDGSSAYRLAVATDGTTGSFYGDYLAGNFARGTGLVDEAATYFENALQAAPDNLELLEQVFELTLASGDFSRAGDQAAKLVAAEPEADEARLLLALDEARRGDFAAAREQADAIGERGIAALAVPFIDAWAIVGEGGQDAADRAIARLEQGESLGPLNDYHAAMILYLAGHPEEGLATLQKAMPEAGRAPTRMAQAHAAMQAASGERAAAIEFLESQLAELSEQPHLEQALAALAAGQAPTLPFKEATGGMADALLGIGEALHQERGGQRAVTYVRLAQYLRPDMNDAALLIGDIMAEQENYAAAIDAYEEVEADAPLHFVAELRKARALYQLERNEAAYKALEDLARKEPEQIDALVQLGDLLRREEEYARAEDAYSRAIERIDEPGAEHWSLFYTRGITFERTERWPRAETDFLKALELEPEQPFVLNYLGYSWVDKGMHLDKAKDMLRRAVELRPNDGFIVDSLGWVHYRLGEYRDAVDRLERAVELEPGDPVINDHLGDAYWRVGRQREARYQWERALTLEPEEDVAEEIRKKMKSGLPAKSEVKIDRI